MIDKAHLRDKRVLFRFNGMERVYAGVVKYVEDDGFWIEARDLLAELKSSGPRGGTEEMVKPILFIPSTSIQFLVAAEE